MEKKQTQQGKDRVHRIKEAHQAALRDSINAKRCMTALQKVSDEVDENPDMSTNRVGALRLKADIQFKLLNKVLPDLKAIEHSGEGGGPLTVVVKRFEYRDSE
jgi:carbon monoxide dehydrogenase subunit G